MQRRERAAPRPRSAVAVPLLAIALLVPGSAYAASEAPDVALLELDRFDDIALGMTLQDVVRADPDTQARDIHTDGARSVVVVETSTALVTLHDGVVVEIRPTVPVRVERAGLGDPHTDLEPWLGVAVDIGSDTSGPWFLYQPRRGGAEGLLARVDEAGVITDLAICLCATPTSSLDDIGFWEVTTGGVGPLSLGLTAADVRAVIPESVEPPAADDDGSPPWLLIGEEWATGVTATLRADGTVGSYTIGTATQNYPLRLDGDELPSAHGIRVGDSGSAVREVFPDGTSVRDGATGITQYVVADRRGRVLTFTVSQRGGWTEDVLSNSVVIGITVEDVTTRANAS